MGLWAWLGGGVPRPWHGLAHVPPQPGSSKQVSPHPCDGLQHPAPTTPAARSPLSSRSLTIGPHAPACAFCAIEFHPLSIPLGSRSSRELQLHQGQLFIEWAAQEWGASQDQHVGCGGVGFEGHFPLFRPPLPRWWWGVTSSCQLWIKQVPRGTNWRGCSAGICRGAGSTGTTMGGTSLGQVPHFPGQGGSLTPQGSFPASVGGTTLGTAGRALAGSSAVADSVSWGTSSMAGISWGILVVAISVSLWHGGFSVGTPGRRTSLWTVTTHDGLSPGHTGGTWPVRATLQVGTVPEERWWGASFTSPLAHHVPSPHQHGQGPEAGDPGCLVVSPPLQGGGQGTPLPLGW